MGKHDKKVESELKIDLDEEFEKDEGSSLIEKLTYTTDDALHKRPLKCNIALKS